MVIKYPEHLSRSICARIAHRCFGRDLLTENKEGFVVRSTTNDRKFNRYTLSLDTLEKYGEEEFLRRAYPNVKEFIRQIRSNARSNLNGHIKTKNNYYNPATGMKDAKVKKVVTLEDISTLEVEDAREGYWAHTANHLPKRLNNENQKA